MSGLSEISLRERLARSRNQYENALAIAVQRDEQYPGENVDLDELRQETLDAALDLADATAPGEMWILQFQAWSHRGMKRYRDGGQMVAVFASRDELDERVRHLEANANADGHELVRISYEYTVYRTKGYGHGGEVVTGWMMPNGEKETSNAQY